MDHRRGTPPPPRSVRLLFLAAALFDGLLGLAFLVAPGALFTWLGVPWPANFTYVNLAAGLIAAQGLGYALVWRRPWRNADLVVTGIACKLAYIGAAGAALARGDLPHPVFGWFAVVDIIFIAGFLLFLRHASDVRYEQRIGQRVGAQLDPPRYWTHD